MWSLLIHKALHRSNVHQDQLPCLSKEFILQPHFMQMGCTLRSECIGEHTINSTITWGLCSNSEIVGTP